MVSTEFSLQFIHWFIEKCLDSLYVSSGRLRNKEVCKSNCFPAINEAGGSRIRVSFVSGQCCQKCGYRIVVRCIPQLSISGPRGIKGSKGSQGPVKRDIEEHNVRDHFDTHSMLCSCRLKKEVSEAQ